MDDCSPAKIGLGVAGVLVVAIVVLIATCFGTLEPTEYGLAYNTLTKDVDKDNIYEGGRHWIWFTSSFIVFPANYRTIEFSTEPRADQGPLKTRTKEGLSLTLHVSFQYQLIKEQIPDLYDMSNLQYEATFIRIARDTILQEAGNHQAAEYWTKREYIGNKMHTLLNEALMDGYARCKGIQMLKVILPTSFEKSIISTQVEKQKTRMKQLEQEAEIVRQNTLVLTSEAEQDIVIINSMATSKAILIVEKARAEAFEKTLNMESYIYNVAQKELEFTNKDLAEYQYLQALINQQNKTLLVDIEHPLVQIRT